MRTLIVCIAVAGALGAQSVRLDAAFFEGDRKVVLRELADRLKVAKADDASVLAEVGRAYLAVLEGEKGRAALQAAEARGPKDGEVLRLVAAVPRLPSWRAPVWQPAWQVCLLKRTRIRLTQNAMAHPRCRWINWSRS